ncbi:MAG: Magnesium and cobalt efflux protein CorC [Chlamydiae bacterium]|nr:Magnesium and cobalt efflux protein CorC [Chlamydiota bacterium]
MISAILLGVIALMLVGLFALTATNQALRRIHREDTAKFSITIHHHYYYRWIHQKLFTGHDFDTIYFIVVCSQGVARFLYVFLMMMFLQQTKIFPFNGEDISSVGIWLWTVLYYFLFIFLYIVLGELIPRSFGAHKPRTAIKILSPISSFFMILFFPISYPLLMIYRAFTHATISEDLSEPQMQVKQELIEMIQEADTGAVLDPMDKELIESVMTFRNRIAREIMVPRVDIFSLPGKTTIRDAAQQLEKEGFSRIPVYKNSVDEVMGILMYKDILIKYMEFAKNPDRPEILDTPIETIVKKTMYTPETKRISHLLQEFRKKQLHLAIVVDEYGGTEGIVTIEDILEEIVGEIVDEYDEDIELFTPLTSGVWLLDARMSILDIEEELEIKIPQEADYDTVGGYIYHRTGTIPTRGFVIDHDDFKIEVMKSNERGVEKVKITSKIFEEPSE